MTIEQKLKASHLMARYIAFQSQIYEYNWSVDFDGKKAYRRFIKDLKELNIDFNDLSFDDARIFGLAEYNNIYLLPLYLYSVIPNGTKLYTIDGKEIVKTNTNIANDSNQGYLNYGVKIRGI